MCQDCGCTTRTAVRIDGEVQPHGDHTHSEDHSHHPHDPGHHHPHDHSHDPDSHHPGHHHGDRNATDHIHVDRQTLTLAANILQKNDRLAERNRGYFLAKNVIVLNLLSSPGSGKTALLERTIRDLNDRHQNHYKMGVIVGDLETENDADRLRQTGATAIQILTGTLCHLEADMILTAAQKLDLDAMDFLVIENVGNLVCPAAYDLGENIRVALLSVTEGEDKPLKYPTLFKSVDLALITKIDLAEAVGFDREKAITNLQKMAPQAKILELSARSGAGMEQWYDYLTHSL